MRALIHLNHEGCEGCESKVRSKCPFPLHIQEYNILIRQYYTLMAAMEPP